MTNSRPSKPIFTKYLCSVDECGSPKANQTPVGCRISTTVPHRPSNAPNTTRTSSPTPNAPQSRCSSIRRGDGCADRVDSALGRGSESANRSSPPQHHHTSQAEKQQRVWLGDGDAVGDEDAGGAVGERGREGELAPVVERARPAVAVAAGMKAKTLSCGSRRARLPAGRRADDELQGAAIRSPRCRTRCRSPRRSEVAVENAIWPASLSAGRNNPNP